MNAVRERVGKEAFADAGALSPDTPGEPDKYFGGAPAGATVLPSDSKSSGAVFLGPYPAEQGEAGPGAASSSSQPPLQHLVDAAFWQQELKPEAQQAVQGRGHGGPHVVPARAGRGRGRERQEASWWSSQPAAEAGQWESSWETPDGNWWEDSWYGWG